MPKIVHVHHSLMPGMGYQENQLPPKIAQQGYDIEVVTSSFPPTQFSDQEDDFTPGTYEYNGVRTHRLPAHFRVESIGQGFLKRLEAKLDEINPDIIQARSLLTIQTPRLAHYCKKNDICFLVDEHIDNDNFNINSNRVEFLYRIYKNTLAKYVIKNCEAFLPVQGYSKEFLIDEFGINPNKIELLPLGVDKSLFYNDNEAGNDIRNALNISNDEFLIITAGNFDSRKDLDIIIDSFNMLECNKEVKLLFLGRPSGEGGKIYYERIKKKVQKQSLQKDVLFEGFVPRNELNNYYNAADIGIWPGKLGVTTAEAVGSGLPLIVCDSAATNYLVSNDNGFTFNRGDTNELYEIINEYINNPKLVQEHSRNSVELSKRTLSWEAIAKKNIGIYRQVCETKFDNK